MTESPPADPRRGAGGKLRTVAVGVLVVLVTVTFTGSLVGVWARRSLLNTEVFSERAVPLGTDPAVQAAVGAFLTGEIMTVVDPQALFEEALPAKGKVLAVPMTAAVRTFVSDQVATFLASAAFARLWTGVVTKGHAAMIRLVRGDSQIVSTNGDAVVINLVPVINAVLARIGELSPDLFGHPIDLPTLTVDDVPDASRAKLAQALGKDVPPQFGVIEIAGAGNALQAARHGVRLFDLLVWALVILTLVLALTTLLLTRHRRRTLLQLVVALSLGTVLVRRLALGLQGELLQQVKLDPNRNAMSAIMREFGEPLLNTTTVVLWLLLLVAAVAVVTGPYRWAAVARELGRQLLSGATSVATGPTPSAGAARAAGWARGHAGTLQVVGVAAAIVALLVLDLGWTGVLILALALGAYLGLVWWLRRPAPTVAT